MVDILVGVEKQTLECIKLLNKPFVIVLNKIDLIYGWKTTNDSIIDGLKIQEKHILLEYNNRVRYIWTQFQELGYNTALYYNNTDFVNMGII